MLMWGRTAYSCFSVPDSKICKQVWTNFSRFSMSFPRYIHRERELPQLEPVLPAQRYDNIRFSMSSKQIITGVVGVVIGFILGFFVSRFAPQTSPSSGPQQPAAAAQSSSRIPEGHPPPEVVEQLREFQERAKANPEDKQIRIVLGNMYYDMGRFDAAIDWYEQALKLDPVNLNVRTDLGTSYLYTGEADKAIEMYQKSLETKPHHPQTLQNLGFAYFATEKFGAAIETWQKLIDAHPTYPHREEIKKQMESARARLKKERS